MSEAEQLLAEYGELADRQRRLIDDEAFDELNASFERVSELEALIKESLRGEKITDSVRGALLSLHGKVSENSELLSARIKELGKSNARRADIRRGLAGYDPLPYSESDVINIKM